MPYSEKCMIILDKNQPTEPDKERNTIFLNRNKYLNCVKQVKEAKGDKRKLFHEQI